MNVESFHHFTAIFLCANMLCYSMCTCLNHTVTGNTAIGDWRNYYGRAIHVTTVVWYFNDHKIILFKDIVLHSKFSNLTACCKLWIYLRFAVHHVLSLGFSTKVTEFMSQHFTYCGQKRTTTSKRMIPSVRLKKVTVQSLLHHLYLVTNIRVSLQ